ncbi:methylated-DNA--[protein]-cysteine S-methyltransferase [Candidatus Sumerlaeota bacterium]|nr:methylated-DNA--[protein]-cysteine S-methyltransferase [Candidatus Sumerlaeota bacterium]
MKRTHARDRIYCLHHTAWGWVALAATDFGVCNTCLPVKAKTKAIQQLKDWKAASGGAWIEDPRAALLINAVKQFDAYFAGELREFTLPLDLFGVTLFRRRVYECAMQTLPYGEICSYGELADRIQAPKSARAVGQAMGVNPIPPIMPCHRVIASDGGLGGFGPGLDMKQRMLEMENREVFKLR